MVASIRLDADLPEVREDMRIAIPNPNVLIGASSSSPQSSIVGEEGDAAAIGPVLVKRQLVHELVSVEQLDTSRHIGKPAESN